MRIFVHHHLAELSVVFVGGVSTILFAIFRGF